VVEKSAAFFKERCTGTHPQMVSGSEQATASAQNLEAPVRDILRETVRLRRVIIRGVERTRIDFVQSLLDASLSEGQNRDSLPPESSRRSLTLEELLERASLATERLRLTECFRAVDILIDESAVPANGEPTAESVPCDALVTVREAPPFSLRIGTSTDTRTGETALELDGGFINFTGTGDALHCQLGAGVGGSGFALSSLSSLAALVHPNRYLFAKQTATNHLVCGWRKPHPWGLLDALATASAESALLNRMDTSSYSEFQRSFEAGLQTRFGRFAYEYSWRELGQVAPHASIRVREQAGHSVKSSFKYTWTRDGRDDPLAPRQGTNAQWNCELAGLGGDPATRFIRSELSWQWNVPLTGADGSELVRNVDDSLAAGDAAPSPPERLMPPIVFSVGFQGGMIIPFHQVLAAMKDRKSEHRAGPRHALRQTRICDRFFVGGSANAFRGFRNRGLGPSADGDSIGGDVYYKLGLHLGVPIVTSAVARSLGLQFHTFCAIGDCREWSDAVAWRQSWRMSAGLGLACCTSLGRFEVNWARILRRGDGDRFDEGFSISFFQSFSP